MHLREQVSLLLSEGHGDATNYPVAMVWEEVDFCVDRQNRLLASKATLLQAAASTAVAAFGKDGGRRAFQGFQSLIKRLSGSGDPAPRSKNAADLVNKGRDGNGAKRR